MISVSGSFFGEEEIREVADSIRNQWVGLGKKVDRFEELLQARLELPNFLMLNSGSNALYMAVYLLALPPQSEIILPSFTWLACANAVVNAGHIPVFCDVEEGTYNVSADTIKPHITDKTGAIMVVHYAGKAVNMEPILELGYPIIEDAAHALDTYYKGRICGSMGDVGTYSFDAIKNLAVGEAGGITVKSEAHWNRAKRLRYSGVEMSGFRQLQEQGTYKWWEYNIVEAFHKMMPSDLSGSIALVQLEKLNSLQQRRKEIWDMYMEAFQDVPWILTPAGPAEGETHSRFTYIIRVPKRTQLAHYLYKKGIYTTLRFHPLHLNPIYKSKVSLPFSEEVNETGLNIPLHPRLTDQEVRYVIDCILDTKAWQ